MAETSTTTTVTTAGPEAGKEQQRRVSKWSAQAHDLLDEYGIPRMEAGENRGENRWLSLPERVQRLNAKLESWRKRAFRAEKRFEDEFLEPDSAEPETPTPPREVNH